MDKKFTGPLLTKRQLLAISSAALATACTSKPPLTNNITQKRPNILMIMVDDLNDWIGAMNGHPQSKTPHIDSLANEGTLFTNAHAQAPICGPSRTSLMSGLLPSTTGVYGHINDEDIRLASPSLNTIPFLPEFMGNAGYHTMGIGKLFHQGAPENVFHEFGGRHPGFGPKPEKTFQWSAKGTSTDWGVYPSKNEDMPDIKSAQWAADRLKAEYEKPFFLSVGFLRPHVPWYVPQEWFDMHPAETLWLPPYNQNDWDDIPEKAKDITGLPNMPDMPWVEDNKQWKNIVQAYLASVSFVDHCTGIVLSALKNSAHSDNTLVVFCSDHGYHLGEKGLFQKFTLWQRSTRVPLILSGHNIPASKTVSAPAGLIDIYPTLTSVIGEESPDWSQGKSLSPLLNSTELSNDRIVTTTYGPGNHAIRDERYTLIEYADDSLEFYDRELDPNEWRNLVDDESYKDALSNLMKHIPKSNAVWSEKSQLNISPYYREDKNKWPN